MIYQKVFQTFQFQGIKSFQVINTGQRNPEEIDLYHVIFVT